MKRNRKLPKHKKGAWFVAVRGSYLPVSWQAWLSYVPYVAYLVFALVIAERSAQSFGQMVLILVPNWVAALVVMTWVAKRTS